MGNPIVHFEVIGTDAPRLREFYGALFGWDANVKAPVAAEISAAGNYGFIDAPAGSAPVPIGVGGGPSFRAHAVAYVGVPDVAEALARAISLGGSSVLEPARRPDGALVVAHFADPEGNVVGLAGPR
ncbi:MAG TPA: VOC family protein [Myxococcota bacterium]